MPFSKTFFLFFLLAFWSCQKNTEQIISGFQIEKGNNLSVSADSLLLNPDEGLVYYQGKPFTGTAESYYENGKKASSIDYWQGRKQGFYKKWFADGRLSFSSRYKNGKRQGLTSTWWKNGNLRSESNYDKGVPHGLQKQWYVSGAKFKQMNLVYGQEEGLQQSWRENGKLYNNYEAKNGRIFGLKRANLCFSLDDETIVSSTNKTPYAED